VDITGTESKGVGVEVKSSDRLRFQMPGVRKGHCVVPGCRGYVYRYAFTEEIKGGVCGFHWRTLIKKRGFPQHEDSRPK
jgi:hypothetical protein